MMMSNGLIADEKKGLFKWKYVVLGIIIMICLGTVYSWSVFRRPVEELYNVGASESGFPYMVSLVFYSVFMLISGRWLDKYSPRFFILVGGILVSIGWILSAYAPNILFLTITYGVICGSGVGIAYGAPMTVVARWFPERKGLAVGIVLVGFGLSPLVTAPVSRRLIEIVGIKSSFIILGIAFGVIIASLSFLFSYPRQNMANNKHDKVDIKSAECNTAHMIRSSRFKGLYLNFVIGTMIGLMMVGMTSLVGMDVFSLNSTQISIAISLFAVFNGIGRPFYGWLIDKISPRKAIFLSYSLIAIASIIFIANILPVYPLFLMSFSLFWFNLGGWLSIAPASTLKMFGIRNYSQNYGVVFTAYGIGALIGVSSSGAIIDFTNNYNLIFYFILALCIIGTILTAKYIRD